MFYISHDAKTGDIINYTEAPNASHHAVAEGHQVLAFDRVPEGLVNSNGTLMMKVDVTKKELAFINPKVLPKPIE